MGKQRVTQKADVLKYLQTHKSISQMQAYTKFKAPITRLAAIICKLRKEGYNLVTKERESVNEYGTHRYAEYTLIK